MGVLALAHAKQIAQLSDDVSGPLGVVDYGFGHSAEHGQIERLLFILGRNQLGLEEFGVQQIGRQGLVKLVRKTGHQSAHACAFVGQGQLPNDLFTLHEQGTQILIVLQSHLCPLLISGQLLLGGYFLAVVLVDEDLHEADAQHDQAHKLPHKNNGVVPCVFVQIGGAHTRQHGQGFDTQGQRQQQASPLHRSGAFGVMREPYALTGDKVFEAIEGVVGVKQQHDGAFRRSREMQAITDCQKGQIGAARGPQPCAVGRAIERAQSHLAAPVACGHQKLTGHHHHIQGDQASAAQHAQTERAENARHTPQQHHGAAKSGQAIPNGRVQHQVQKSIHPEDGLHIHGQNGLLGQIMGCDGRWLCGQSLALTNSY